MAIKKIIYLERPQQELLKRLSLEQSASETEVMRRALDLYARDRLNDPLAELIGTFHGVPAQGAKSHDRYVLKPRRSR